MGLVALRSWRCPCPWPTPNQTPWKQPNHCLSLGLAPLWQQPSSVPHPRLKLPGYLPLLYYHYLDLFILNLRWLTLLQVKFHPIFIKDVSQATTVDEMAVLVKKYGTHYYKSALMGGQLSQITVVDSSFESSSSSKEVLGVQRIWYCLLTQKIASGFCIHVILCFR